MIATFARLLNTHSQRLAMALALSASALLVACGSGSTFEPLVPTRIVSFGDGLSDLGQSGSRYTVNDDSVNIWPAQLAVSYGNTLTASITGGLGFAAGDARVNTGANSIAAQITTFLGTNTIGASDLLIVDAGVAELVALAAANASDAALATAADAAGKALGAQVKRLTSAGGQHVVINNAPNIGKSPFAITANRVAGLNAATRAFNDGIKIALADVTSGVLLVDTEAYVNSLITTPTTLGEGGNVTTPACSTTTAAIALNCTTATLSVGVTSATYNVYLYADDRYPTPAAHRLIGINAYNRVKARW